MLLLIPTRKSGITSVLREEKDITFQMDELQHLLSDLGQRGQKTVPGHRRKQGSTTTAHEFQREQGGLDTMTATELPLCTLLSHSGPISAIKNLTAAAKDVFPHPTSDGQTFSTGPTAHPTFAALQVISPTVWVILFSHTPELQVIVLKIRKALWDHQNYSRDFWSMHVKAEGLR